MTPLAHQIVKELILPQSKRSFEDPRGLLPRMRDIHCFECSDVVALAGEIRDRLPEIGLDERFTFLPAPRTWIEFEQVSSGLRFRTGYLLIENKEKNQADVYMAQTYGSQWFSQRTPADPLRFDYRATGPDKPGLLKARQYFVEKCRYDCEEMLLALLALINSPRVIGRHQHMPHRGLERRLLARRGSIGSFPLHAWTEIKLEVTAPNDLSDDDSSEAHLTGRRALHFCRAHLRIRMGQIEFVRSHWRGDPALGKKQSRYRLTG